MQFGLKGPKARNGIAWAGARRRVGERGGKECIQACENSLEPRSAHGTSVPLIRSWEWEGRSQRRLTCGGYGQNELVPLRSRHTSIGANFQHPHCAACFDNGRSVGYRPCAMPSQVRYLVIFGSLLALTASAAEPSGLSGTDSLRNWPQWRRPLATGMAPNADPPVHWSEPGSLAVRKGPDSLSP